MLSYYATENNVWFSWSMDDHITKESFYTKLCELPKKEDIISYMKTNFGNIEVLGDQSGKYKNKDNEDVSYIRLYFRVIDHIKVDTVFLKNMLYKGNFYINVCSRKTGYIIPGLEVSDLKNILGEDYMYIHVEVIKKIRNEKNKKLGIIEEYQKHIEQFDAYLKDETAEEKLLESLI